MSSIINNIVLEFMGDRQTPLLFIDQARTSHVISRILNESKHWYVVNMTTNDNELLCWRQVTAFLCPLMLLLAADVLSFFTVPAMRWKLINIGYTTTYIWRLTFFHCCWKKVEETEKEGGGAGLRSVRHTEEENEQIQLSINQMPSPQWSLTAMGTESCLSPALVVYW